MKKLITILITLSFMLGLFSTVSADNSDTLVTNWVLGDNTKNIEIMQLKFPIARLVNGKITLSDLTAIMKTENSLTYLRTFNSRNRISNLVAYGLNSSQQVVMKVTLWNAVVTSYIINKADSDTYASMSYVSVSFSFSKITTERYKTPSTTPISISAAAKTYDFGKIYIDGVQTPLTTQILLIIGQSSSNNSSGATGSGVSYEYILHLDYGSMNNLPDWLASTDLKTQTTTTVPIKHTIRYELSNSVSGDKIYLDMVVNFVREDLQESSGRMSVSYSIVPVSITPSTPPATISGLRTLTKSTVANWKGVWDTTYGEMTLTQNGTNVEGTVGDDSFTITGTISGKKLTGTWSDGTNEGTFIFTQATDGKSFTGTRVDSSTGVEGESQWDGDLQ